jgi:hypothetical protein
MKVDIYRTVPDARVDYVLEELREKISEIAGVTLSGNRLTIRWYPKWQKKHQKLVSVHMAILEVENDEPERVPEDK